MSGPTIAGSAYESDQYLHEYLLFHFGQAEDFLPWTCGPTGALHFPVRTARAVELAGLREGAGGRALDLGCAVGRSTFELARYHDHVLGVDFSHRFIDAARHLATGATLTCQRLDEGLLTTPVTVSAPTEPDWSGRVDFQQGDAMNLPADWVGFDTVHAVNLLCRLPDPIQLVRRFPNLVKPGGILVLATPCSWLPSYTPYDRWLGGFVEDGRPVRTLDRLNQLLTPDFNLAAHSEEPFLIREHARKFQWNVSHLTVWVRKR